MSKTRWTMWPVTTALIALGLGALIAGCSTHPAREARPYQAAAAPAATGAIARFVAQLETELDHLESAYWLVASSMDAFVTRLVLFDSAQASLDVQYFIWQDDASGDFMLERLLAAADRGVRVRLLIDDVSVFSQDRKHAALAMHPNIEMRTFNPWRSRGRIVRGLEFLARAGVLNHRLHNKTIIADGRMAILGGRNIGDRYFGVYDVFVQNDLDIMFAGSMAASAVENFDRFWNSPWSVPIESLLRPRRRDLTLDTLRAELAAGAPARAESLAAFPLTTTDWTEWLRSHNAGHFAGKGRFIEDLPEVWRAAPTQLKHELTGYLAQTQSELILATAYFIPDDELLDLLTGLATRGVRVVLLTNSMQSNNHMLAHVAYKRSRLELVRAGVELYELKPDGALLEVYGVAPVEPGFMGLHSKAAIVDGRSAFVGTPNLDPRSLDLNAESGVIVESVELATALRALILEAADQNNAWRVRLDSRGGLDWTSAEGTLERQPANGPGQRIMQFIYSLLPIKNQA